jgi:hypothetical protein
MTTIRTLVHNALGMLRVRGSAGTINTRDGETALSAIQSLLLSLPSLGLTGKLTNVRTSVAYEAGEDERIFNTDPSNVTITLPTRIYDECSPEADAAGYREPHNGAVVQVVGASPRTFVFVGYLGAWKELSGLTLDSENPLGPEHDRGLAAMLAIEIAPFFINSDPPNVVALTAERGQADIRFRFRQPNRPVAVDSALLRLTGPCGEIC